MSDKILCINYDNTLHSTCIYRIIRLQKRINNCWQFKYQIFPVQYLLRNIYVRGGGMALGRPIFSYFQITLGVLGLKSVRIINRL